MTAPTTEKRDTSLHGPNLILDVENFGPISEAKNIEFKPMTVLVGPSNTGKTYLAMLLHSFAQAIDQSNRTTEGFQPRHDTQPRRFGLEQQSDIVDDFRHFGRIFSHGKSPDGASWDCVPFAAFSSTTQAAMSAQIDDHRDRVAKTLTDTVLDFFGVHSLLDLANRAASEQSQALPRAEFHVNSIDVSIEFTGIHIRQPPIGLNIPPAYVDYRAMSELETNPEEPRIFVAEIEGLIAINYADLFFDVPISFYLPAGRTGLMDTRELLLFPNSRGLLGENLSAQDSVRINRATRDCIDLLNAARQRPTDAITNRPTLKRFEPFRGRRPRHNIAGLLESSVIDGRISIDPSKGATEIQYVRDGLSIPVPSASSMVSEIAPILIYSRSYLVEGDLVIIDEPEAHLHPEAQQQMAAALAFMVRSGLRVLITTHSHYMVEQLGNFVAVSTLDEDIRKRTLKLAGALGDEDIYLDESEVAVYDFATDKSEHGSVVEPVEFNSRNYGYFTRDHNWAIADQMNRTQRVIEARIDQDDPVTAR